MVFWLLFDDGFVFVTRLMLFGYSQPETMENVMNSELLFCDGFIFDTRLMLFGVHTLETVENITNSERPYSGVNFELQLLSHVPSEMQIGEANAFRWGRRAKVIHVKSEVTFCMLFATEH